MTDSCPFCEIAASDRDQHITHQDDLAFVIRDRYPVSKGHSLIIVQRHVESFFETTDSEKAALISLLENAKQALDNEFSPQAYNIGINDGIAAGQTVPHLHIHLIPRYEGDVNDPRGGVRWILSEKAIYWEDQA